MNNEIYLIPNFISEEDCDLGISLIDNYNKEKQLKLFKNNPKVCIAPMTDDTILLLKKYSKLVNEKHKELRNLDKEVYTSETYLSFWQTGSEAGLHNDNHEGFEWLEFSTLLYLNDDYEGGEIHFPEYDFLHKPKKGDALFFKCSRLEDAHEVKTVKSGQRYTIAMWHCTDKEKEFKYLN